MSLYIYRAAFIVPDAHRDNARALNEQIGWGPGTYSCPLSADGSEPATHWGLSTVATQTARDIIGDAATGQAPEGIDPAAAQTVVNAARSKWGANATDPGAQFDALCAEVGVQRIISEI